MGKSFHLDFKRAFSHADLEEEVCVRMPQGFVKRNGKGQELALLLHKSSEGLKQSAANWQEILFAKLKSLGFEENVKEPCLFKIEMKDGSVVIVLIYVDDVFGVIKPSDENDEWYGKFLESLSKIAPIKDLGPIQKALGVTVERDGDSVSLSCRDKIVELLKTHDLEDLKGRNIPLTACKVDTESPLLNDKAKTLYQSITGSLLYIMRAARPECAYAVWYCCCGMTAPTEFYWKKLMELLRYLKWTKDYKLAYSRTLTEDRGSLAQLLTKEYGYTINVPMLFCDSDYGVTSVSSTVVMLHGGAIRWSVTKQKTVSLSSVQSELTALSSCGQDSEWMSQLSCWMKMRCSRKMQIFCDNRGAIMNSKHKIAAEKLRHVQVKVFYIRSLVSRGRAIVQWVAGEDNPADLGTKISGSTNQLRYSRFLLNFSNK